jgi:AbiV family abortive infection protein
MKGPQLVLRADLQEGIEMCKENALEFIEDARIIAGTGKFHHAVISLEYALEEFGKALLLKEARDDNGKDKEVIINFYYNHNKKVERALDSIDNKENYRLMFKEITAYHKSNGKSKGAGNAGVWKGDHYEPIRSKLFFQVNSSREEPMCDKTRQNCCFVGYEESDWILWREIPVDAQKNILSLIDLTEKELKKPL